MPNHQKVPPVYRFRNTVNAPPTLCLCLPPPIHLSGSLHQHFLSNYFPCLHLTYENHPSYNVQTRRHHMATTFHNLEEIAPDELVTEGLAQAGGRALDDDASGLEGLDLGVGAALAAGDDGTGVAHAAAGGARRCRR